MAFRSWSTERGGRLLDVLYPRRCASCEAGISGADENGLCWDCRSDVHPLTPPWCECCGMVVAGRLDHTFTCSDCKEHPPVYRRGRSLYHYEGGIRDAIHALKYHQDFSVIPDLARIVLAGVRAHLVPEGEVVVCPVPLHSNRRRYRGFNQGEEILRQVMKLDPQCRMWKGIRRVKDTKSQTQLSKAERRTNVQGAFTPRRVLNEAPEQVILVDDVMTTGATLNACARALGKAGVDEVMTLTVARG